jgi:hypothetical protein
VARATKPVGKAWQADQGAPTATTHSLAVGSRDCSDNSLFAVYTGLGVLSFLQPRSALLCPSCVMYLFKSSYTLRQSDQRRRPPGPAFWTRSDGEDSQGRYPP